LNDGEDVHRFNLPPAYCQGFSGSIHDFPFSGYVNFSPNTIQCLKGFGTPSVYHPRRPQQSPLWQLLNDQKILKHLQLWHTEHPDKPPPETRHEDIIDYQPYDDGWGDYQEPSITLH